MLAVARALMSSPKILLIDEPSVGLAPILVSRVSAKIRELKERVHGRIEFGGQSTQELRENELVKKYYLGV